MKLGDKILKLRKEKGLSQEQLGERINVTRQTVSNWELGETSPSVEQLKLLSKEFCVSIDELVDNDIQDVLVEKISNTEKLAGVILRILKISIIVLVAGFVFAIVGMFLFKIIRNSRDTGRELEESIYCTIYGEEHGYSIIYEELTGQPIVEGGDSYFNDILDLDKYNDAHQIFNVINDYVKKNGGTCTMIDARDLSDIVSIEIQDLKNTSMKIVIHDTSSNRIIYGSDFYIQKDVKGHWEAIEETGENYGFDDMAYYVDENGILEMRQDWTHMYGKLSKGIYRIVKTVFFESDIPVDKGDSFYIWQEFEIEE